MICPHCHREIQDDARFCPACGAQLNGREAAAHDAEGSETADRFAGTHSTRPVSEPADQREIRLRDVFSETFKKHTEEEAEKKFIVGTRATTPPIEKVLDTWPKPWLYAKVFLTVMLVYFGLYLGISYFGNLNFLPGLIFVGAFMVPFTILVFFWEINAPQNVPIYSVVYIVFVGGIISLITALALYETLSGYSGVLIIGFVEEAAKVVAVAWFVRRARYHYILNGLLVGAAVGAGFAAFETAGYALRVVMETSSLQSLYSTILWRGVLAPGGHIVWAALSGAAICMVKGEREWHWSMLLNPRFLRIFAMVVVLHAVWDLLQLEVLSVPLIQVLLTLLSWAIAFTVIHTGLKEITLRKREAALLKEDAEAREPIWSRPASRSAEGAK